MKKLLILNGSHSDIPLIAAAKSLGFFVITTGNKPSLVGHAHADLFVESDFKDLDRLSQIVESHKVDAVCSCAHDGGLLAASYLAEKFSLPGHDPYEVTKTLLEKDLFKEFALSISLPTPTAKFFVNEASALNYFSNICTTQVIKPVDSGGGKGVHLLIPETDIKDHVKNAFRHSFLKRILIEDYVPGSLCSFSVLIKSGQVVLAHHDNEFSTVNPFTVSSSSSPSILSTIMIDELRDWSEKISNALLLKDGILHFQVIVNDTEFKILEITRRCSGDFHPVQLSYALGVSWPEIIVRSEAGQPLELLGSFVQKNFWGRHVLMAEKNGIISGINISKRLEPYIIENNTFCRIGEQVTNFQTEKLAVLILNYKSESEMKHIVPSLRQLAFIETRS